MASRLKAIIDTAIDGIITIDSLGNIESANPAAAKLFGYTEEFMLGKNISILMPEPYRSAHDHYLVNYLNTKHPKIIGVGREVLGVKSDGTTFPFRLAVSEVVLENKTIFTGIIHDLTLQKQAEEQLMRYAAQLERSNKDLEDFAFISSHDLQEPLRKIRAFGSRLLEREHSALSDQSKDYLDRMLKAAERMQRLINDLLGFSRLNTHAKPFELIQLNEVLTDVLSDLEVMIGTNQAKIIADELPPIEADPTQMRQLFQNILSNAIKFRKPDLNPVITIKSHIKSSQDEMRIPKLVIEISDNGIGFDNIYSERIFQIFQRLETGYSGSGIGLAICKRIVSRHGGEITAHAAKNQGAVFLISLPVKQYTSS